MEHKDNFLLKGDIYLRIFDKKGNTIHEYSFSNLVVDSGKLNTVKLLGGDPDGKPVTKFGVGTSNTPATVSDTTLTGVYSNSLDPTVTYSGNKAIYEYLVDTSEANGMIIREIGLFNDDDVLIARKVLDTPIVKNSGFGFNGAWALRVV